MGQADNRKPNFAERLIRRDVKVYFNKEAERKLYFIAAIIIMVLSLISTIKGI